MAALATATVPLALSIGVAWEITGARAARPQYSTYAPYLSADQRISAPLYELAMPAIRFFSLR